MHSCPKCSVTARKRASRWRVLLQRCPPRTEIKASVVSRDGTEIAYWTSGGGPPIVLVHGAPADHSRWLPLLPICSSTSQFMRSTGEAEVPAAMLRGTAWNGSIKTLRP